MSLSAGQLHAIEVTERACSVLSLLGSTFVITSFLWSRRFHTPINRLIFYASWGNAFANVATLISTSGPLHGADSSLCQFQGFFMQWFIPADALWAFCMAFNVYLTLFRRYDTSELRKLEWRYCAVCYGLPFVPAFVYLFVETDARGKIYGSAIQWCWVRMEWAPLRVAVTFGPVWILILLSAAIYISGAKKILNSRRRLRSLAKRSSQSPSATRNLSDPVDSGSRTATSSSIVPLRCPESVAESSSERRRASFGKNVLVWAYCKFAMLFFLALFITWTPPTINRVYSLVHLESTNFVLIYLSAFSVPLQGFWNSIIYVATSYAVVKGLFGTLLPRSQLATSSVSRPNSRESDR